MKKLLKVGYFFALILASITVLYWSDISTSLQSMSNDEGGVLVGIANMIGVYFKNWETWNMIFLILFISSSLVSFVLIDLGVEFLLKKVALKKEKLSFVRKPWFILTIQKGIAGTITLLLFLVLCNLTVIVYGNKHSVKEAVAINESQPVLILGTSKMLKSGKGENLYYRYRIDAAKDLWENNKASYFIISGDKSKTQMDVRGGFLYDETRDITNDLKAFGVPEDKIKVDTAGFRTLDSMVRIRGLFKVKNLIVISQQFHVQRALFLAMFYNVNGTGYYAKGSSTTAMLIRETFGKCKLVLDIVLFNMMPKVALEDESLMKYREDFQVKSDLHVILLLVVSIAGLSSLGLMFKAID